MAGRTKFVLDEADMPTQWYNVVADLPEPPPPPLHPGTGEPVGPDDLAPLFPMALIEQEVSDGAVHPDPGRGAGGLPAVAALAAVPGAPAGEGARHAGADLLQVRGRQPGRLAQAEHRRAAGVLQRRRRASAQLTTETGAGQWGSALAFACAQFGLECEVWQVARVVRPEAVPQDHDGDVRRDRAPEPVGPDRIRPRGARGAPGLDRQPRHRDQRGGRDGRRRPGRAVRARQRAQPRAACTRRSSARRRCGSSRWPATRPT